MKIRSLDSYNLKICKYYCISYKLSILRADCMIQYVQIVEMWEKHSIFGIYRNLGNNIFPKLPKNGLKNVLHLKTFNNPKLRDFPAPETFPRIQVSLSYFVLLHCATPINVSFAWIFNYDLMAAKRQTTIKTWCDMIQTGY